MSERNQQIAVWLALPLGGLLLMVGVLSIWGAAYVIAPIALVLAVVVVFVMMTRRKEG